MTEHDLKCWPEFFQPLIEGRKPFDYRLNDRDFQVGDVLHQREFVPGDYPPDGEAMVGFYTGRSIRHRVTYMLDVDKLGPAAGVRAQPTAGFVIMALGPVEAEAESEIDTVGDLEDFISDALDGASDYDMRWPDYGKRVAADLIAAHAVRFSGKP